MQQTLEAIASALNERGLDDYETARVQEIVAASAGGAGLAVDDGGGLHDGSGARVGAVRRAPSGEWVIDGQNVDAARSDAPIPAAEHEHREPGGDDNQQR